MVNWWPCDKTALTFVCAAQYTNAYKCARKYFLLGGKISFYFRTKNQTLIICPVFFRLIFCQWQKKKKEQQTIVFLKKKKITVKVSVWCASSLCNQNVIDGNGFLLLKRVPQLTSDPSGLLCVEKTNRMMDGKNQFTSNKRIAFFSH